MDDFCLFLIFVTEKISRTDEGQPRPKYIFDKCGTNIYFFTVQRFGSSPSPDFKLDIKWDNKMHVDGKHRMVGYQDENWRVRLVGYKDQNGRIGY